MNAVRIRYVIPILALSLLAANFSSADNLKIFIDQDWQNVSGHGWAMAAPPCDRYSKSSKISDTSCLPKQPSQNRADPDQI